MVSVDSRSKLSSGSKKGIRETSEMGQKKKRRVFATNIKGTSNTKPTSDKHGSDTVHS